MVSSTLNAYKSSNLTLDTICTLNVLYFLPFVCCLDRGVGRVRTVRTGGIHEQDLNYLKLDANSVFHMLSGTTIF